MYNDHLLCNQWALWGGGEWHECVRPLSLCVRGCKSLYIYNREMSTPLWGEREPLARAREDRRAPGRSFTPSPFSIGGGVVGGWWCGGPTAGPVLAGLAGQGTTQGTPGSFIIWPWENSPLWPSGRVCQCCGLWCGLLLCASGGARSWPTMVGCGVWCFVALCPLCVWWWCWWFLPCALFLFAGALPLLCVQRVPGAVLAPVWWLLSAGPGSCLLVPAGEGLPVRSLCPAACMASPRGCSGAFRCLLAFFPTTIVLHYSGVLVRFLFKFQWFWGVPEKRLKNFEFSC